MPPVGLTSELKTYIEDHINNNKVMVFSKSYCPYCNKVKQLFNSLNVSYFALDLDKLDNGSAIQDALFELTGARSVPNVFINGIRLGGCDDTLKAHNEGRLLPQLYMTDGDMAEKPLESYDYDLVVIGGGSGGLAAAKQAADLNAKVACLDFVKPSPRGTSWGLGGTCVNVGCIPKKLFHQAALLGHDLTDAKNFGWEITGDVRHNWSTMVKAVQQHIGSLNFAHKTELNKRKIKYINAMARFTAPHTIECTNKKGEKQKVTSKYFVLATGGRPRYPDIPGIQYCISSDDLFSMSHPPGKTLVVGASYVSLECAGFLAGLGHDVTVMVRSILLRGFDQQMAEKIGKYMEENGVKFIRPCIPMKIEKLEEEGADKPGKYNVTGKTEDGRVVTDIYNTILMAIGRDPETKELDLEKVGVKTNPKTHYVVTKDDEQTSCSYVYAIGDIVDGAPELTPVAIQAGKLLAKRLFGKSTIKMDYVNVPTTIFTPVEYGCIGFSEEDAIAKYGENDIEVYHNNFLPLEWTLAHREPNICYFKLVCVKSLKERVVGFHVFSPNAGEITQGFTVGMRMGATKADFETSVGIHPTCAESLTKPEITKNSKVSIDGAGC